jgi:hypothetical protein
MARFHGSSLPIRFSSDGSGAALIKPEATQLDHAPKAIHPETARQMPDGPFRIRTMLYEGFPATVENHLQLKAALKTFDV